MQTMDDQGRRNGQTCRSTDPTATLIPPGTYHVAFVRTEIGSVFGRRVLFGHFAITESGPYHGLPILRFWNEPRSRVLPRTHNLWKDYHAVTGRRPPSTGLKPVDFLAGCEVLALVATVDSQSQGRRKVALPKDCHYSKIDAFVGISAGCPPCLRRGGV